MYIVSLGLSRLSLPRIATQDVNKFLVVLELQAPSLN